MPTGTAAATIFRALVANTMLKHLQLEKMTMQNNQGASDGPDHPLGLTLCVAYSLSSFLPPLHQNTSLETLPGLHVEKLCFAEYQALVIAVNRILLRNVDLARAKKVLLVATASDGHADWVQRRIVVQGI